MHKYKRLDFIETDLKPGILAACDQYMDMIGSQREQYEKHRARLVVVRETKEKKRLEILGKYL